jgi:hypothetical protein
MMMPDLSRYLQRANWLLRLGEVANSVSLHLPDADSWSGFAAGRVHMIEALREHLGKTVMVEILDAGYVLDFIDDGTLDALPRHKALLLPGVEELPVGSAIAMERFARNGGVVLATRRLPARALGAREPGFGFVPRKLPGADVYFVANTGNRPKPLGARFRHEAGSRGEWWDRLTGFDNAFILPEEPTGQANYAKNPTPAIAPADFKMLGGLQFAGVNGASRGLRHVFRRSGRAAWG